MSLITCPECGKQISDKASVCPQCAYPLTDTAVKTNDGPNSQSNESKSNVTPPPSQNMSTKMFDPKANLKVLVRIAVIITTLLACVWLFIRFTKGEKAANNFSATVIRHPVELTNTIVDLPASSFRTIPLSLPYTGSLTIDVAVINGNSISVYLILPDQIEKLKEHESFKYFGEFSAEKTKNLYRSARFISGEYHLVLMDKTLGIFSKSSSDIKVKVNLEP